MVGGKIASCWSALRWVALAVGAVCVSARSGVRPDDYYYYGPVTPNQPPSPPPPSPPPPLPSQAFIDGQYIRTGTARGNCLSLQPNVSLWQNELVQQPCNGKDKLQRFAFMHIAGGTFRISPSWKRDVCLAAGDIEWGGARLVLQPCSGGVSISQEFFFHPLTGRWWMIGGRYRPGDCLNVVDGSPDAGKLVRLYSCSGNSAQRFILPKFKPELEMPKQVILTSVADNKCVWPNTTTGRGSGTLVQYDCNANEPTLGSNRFIFFERGGGFYRIASSSNVRLCVTVGGRTPSTWGTSISLMDCVYDSASQEFMLSTLDNGWALRPKYDTSLCLDVQWSGAADGTPIQVWECNRTPAQKFLIPAFRPVFQKVLHYEPWPISGNVCIDSQSGSLLHGAGCSSSSPSQQFIFAREGIDGTYRILSGQDWSQCWTIPVVPSLPDWDPEPLAYPVTLTPCSFDIFSQGFIIHEEVPRFGAWILEARGARGKCADVVQGTVVITPCDYSVTQHFNLPGFSLS